MYIRRELKKPPPRWPRIVLLSLVIISLTALTRYVYDQPLQERPFYPSPTPTLNASYHLNDGDIHFAEGRLRQAIEAYDRAITLDPTEDRAYSQQARALVYIGETGQALRQAEQAVVLNPDSPPNLAAYCWASDWEGLYTQALDACECAIELDPTYAPAYAFMAETFADRGDWLPARNTAREALEVDFQSADAQHNMGYALEMQGRYAEATEYYENAIVLRPRLAPYYISAGMNYYWRGQLSQAAELLGEAIKLDPLNPLSYDQLGWTYHTQGEYLRAVDALEQALTVDPAYTRAWGRLGTIYYLRQNYEQAIQLLPKAIELAQRDAYQRARAIEILLPVEGLTGPETVTVLRGRFDPAPGETLLAEVEAVTYTAPDMLQESVQSCGQFIARNINSQMVRLSPTEDLSFSTAFTPTRGEARIDLRAGELSIRLENLPPPTESPYEVQMSYRPNTEESLGYLQPDGQGVAEARFALEANVRVPLEYYYQLGLSYAYMSPPQCSDALPWLLTAVRLDPAYYNPAWAGLRICPSEDSPPTPLPTFTPTPEEPGG